jgi:hypothetical protein
MSEAGRHRPASGFEISDALRGRVHSYGEETRSVLCEERMGETTRTQQQQHLSSSLSFMQVSSYPSGQLRVMSSMVDPPFTELRIEPGNRVPHLFTVESITSLIARVDN